MKRTFKEFMNSDTTKEMIGAGIVLLILVGAIIFFG